MIRLLKGVYFHDRAIELLAREYFPKQYWAAKEEINEAMEELDIHTYSEDELLSVLMGKRVSRAQIFQAYESDPDEIDRVRRDCDYVFSLHSDNGKIISLKRVKVRDIENDR